MDYNRDKEFRERIDRLLKEIAPKQIDDRLKELASEDVKVYSKNCLTILSSYESASWYTLNSNITII